MSNAPDQILKLVEQFQRNIQTYKSQEYNETSLRVDFVNPFFKALGWDVDNEQGTALAYRDVIHEASMKMGGTTKAPDYCFRYGCKNLFFVETKKPAIDLNKDHGPAYQVRRYGWNAKLALSILTDFEEFAVYDCRVRPKMNAKPSSARILYITFDQYAERWDEIASVFSREAVRIGDFDRFAQQKTGRRGTTEVDDEFLKEIESWREILARNIALRNPGLNIRELNFAVQKTIDRIIFLRMCEDRGIENENQLLALTSAKRRIYPRLIEIFEKADQKYNSGLFHFREEQDRPGTPDRISLSLQIDDAVLEQIIKRLYFPESPYEFSIMPPEILGNVYEQFLGKVIRLTSGHQAKVEEKPEVRKAGGVYYTPQYIVDYIVKNTVGKLIAGKTPQQISEVRVLDPACGSGSFLLGAYRFLLDTHLQWYVEEKNRTGVTPTVPPTPGKRKKKSDSPAIFQTYAGDWALTTAEKKRILLNNIYGVDIDPQAVEVTKLSLLLKVLENETEETLGIQIAIWREPALPDLSNNIKCGNSLIGQNIYNESQLDIFDDEIGYRINAFDWNNFKDGFGKIIISGGFDIVISNPPYIRIQKLREYAPDEARYFKNNYDTANTGNYDIYGLFVEKALSLLKNSGVLGFILPHKFFNSKYGSPLRKILSTGKHVNQIIHFGDQQVFKGATTYTCLLFLSKSSQSSFAYTKISDLNEWKNGLSVDSNQICTSSMSDNDWVFHVGPGASILSKLKQIENTLNDVCNIFVGLQTSADPILLFKDSKQSKNDNLIQVFSKHLNKWIQVERSILKRVIRSGHIGQYYANQTAYVLFPYNINRNRADIIPAKTMARHFPHAWNYLKLCRNELERRENGKFVGDSWYTLYPKNLSLWENPKLMVPYMITNLCCFYDRVGDLYFVNVTTGGFGLTIKNNTPHTHFIDYEYLYGLLNSSLLDLYLKHITSNFQGGYFAANKRYIAQLPIIVPNTSSEDYLQLIKSVQHIEKLQCDVSSNTHIPLKTSRINRNISYLKTQIDELVCRLYDIEIKDFEKIKTSN